MPLKESAKNPSRLPRFFAGLLFVSWMVYMVTHFAHDRPDPLRFFFNLSAHRVSVACAAVLPPLQRWVRVDARVNPQRLFYLYESYDSGMNRRGCRVYLAGALEGRDGARLPFRALVSRNPDGKCKKDGTAPAPPAWKMPPDYIARITPGDFSLRRLLALKDAAAFEQYMKTVAPGEFTGMLRVRGADKYRRDPDVGVRAKCWLDVGAYPDFVNAISFLAMAVSCVGVLYLLVGPRRC